MCGLMSRLSFGCHGHFRITSRFWYPPCLLANHDHEMTFFLPDCVPYTGEYCAWTKMAQLLPTQLLFRGSNRIYNCLDSGFPYQTDMWRLSHLISCLWPFLLFRKGAQRFQAICHSFDLPDMVAYFLLGPLTPVTLLPCMWKIYDSGILMAIFASMELECKAWRIYRRFSFPSLPSTLYEKGNIIGILWCSFCLSYQTHH